MTNAQPMHILYVSQYFPPEVGAGSARAFELAKHWVRAGHRVTALTGFPSYPTGWNGNGNGAHPPPGPNRPERIRRPPPRRPLLGHGRRLPHPPRAPDGLVLLFPILIPTRHRHPQARRSPSIIPPPDRRHDRLVAKPPKAKALRIRRPRPMARIRPRPRRHQTRRRRRPHPRRHGRLPLPQRRPDRSNLRSHPPGITRARQNRPRNHLHHPNGVETGMFAPQPPTSPNREKFKQSLGLGGKFIVSFIGTIGLAQDLDLIIRAAEHLSAAPLNARPPRIAEPANPYNPPAQPPTTKPAPNLPYDLPAQPPTTEPAPNLPYDLPAQPPTPKPAPNLPYDLPAQPPTTEHAQNTPYPNPSQPPTAEHAQNTPTPTRPNPQPPNPPPTYPPATRPNPQRPNPPPTYPSAIRPPANRRTRPPRSSLPRYRLPANRKIRPPRHLLQRFAPPDNGKIRPPRHPYRRSIPPPTAEPAALYLPFRAPPPRQRRIAPPATFTSYS